MSRFNIVRELIGAEDLSIGAGTFTRSTSTGATQTLTKISLQSLGANVYNVQDYIGGEPGGTVDNTSGIQDAINACEATGGTVLFPAAANPYRAIGLTVTEPITIAGEGRMSHIKSNGDGSIFIFDEGANQNVEGQNPGAVVRDLYLTGNSRTDNACAFTLSRLDHALFENLWIEEFLGTNETGLNGSAFTFKDTVRECHFTDLRMRYCGTYNSKWVMDISDSGAETQDPSNNNIFTRCAFVYYFGDAVVVTDPGDATSRIRGHKFLDCLFHGVLTTQPIHAPTANDQTSRSMVFNQSEANIVQDCRFSTGPVDNPYIYITDDGTNAPSISPPNVEVRGCLFTAHATSSADMKHAVYLNSGTAVIRSCTFVASDPAWESVAGTIYRDDSNILIGSQATGKIIEAAGTGPGVFSGDGIEQDLEGTFTVQTQDASGVLTRRISAAGGTDTKELKLLGIPFRVGAGVPSHTDDAGGAGINNIALYLRTDAPSNTALLYVTYDSGTTWAALG